jgi:hypothetical protein
MFGAGSARAVKAIVHAAMGTTTSRIMFDCVIAIPQKD